MHRLFTENEKSSSEQTHQDQLQVILEGGGKGGSVYLLRTIRAVCPLLGLSKDQSFTKIQAFLEPSSQQEVELKVWVKGERGASKKCSQCVLGDA